MNYLHDKKIKTKKFRNYSVAVVLLLVLFYFRAGIFGGLSYAVHFVGSPILTFVGSVRGGVGGIGSYFSFKSSLSKENETLKAQILESEADRANYAAVVDENNKLKEILGRKSETASVVLSTILEKPNQSPYDTLIIDVGKDKNILAGSLVFALGNVPVGRVSDVYTSTAKVTLFSNPGEKTDVIVAASKNISTTITGRGGGNFEMILPRELNLVTGTTVTLPGINSYIIASVQTIVTDPRDSFTKALLASPVNIFEQKFVEVQI